MKRKDVVVEPVSPVDDTEQLNELQQSWRNAMRKLHNRDKDNSSANNMWVSRDPDMGQENVAPTNNP